MQLRHICLEYPYKQLEAATGGFHKAHQLGEGSAGTVFKAWATDGVPAFCSQRGKLFVFGGRSIRLSLGHAGRSEPALPNSRSHVTHLPAPTALPIPLHLPASCLTRHNPHSTLSHFHTIPHNPPPPSDSHLTLPSTPQTNTRTKTAHTNAPVYTCSCRDMCVYTHTLDFWAHTGWRPRSKHLLFRLQLSHCVSTSSTRAPIELLPPVMCKDWLVYNRLELNRTECDLSSSSRVKDEDMEMGVAHTGVAFVEKTSLTV